MSERGKFITVHGIDGTGKTTLVRAIEDVIRARGQNSGAEHLASQESPWQRCKDEFSDISLSERIFYKLGSKAAQAALVETRLALGETIVKDRWVIDVLADETHKGAVAPERVFSTILRPDLAVLLVCDESTRTSRIASRGDATPDDLIPCVPGERAYYFQQYLADHMAFSAEDNMQLDSTKMHPAHLAGLVMERVYGQ